MSIVVLLIDFFTAGFFTVVELLHNESRILIDVDNELGDPK